MRRAFVAGVLLVGGFSTPSFAADAVAMEPEIVAVTYPWAGFYAGISGGYGTSTSIDPRFQNNGYESVAEGQVVETPVANWYNFNACFEDAPSGWGNGSFDYCGDAGDADGWFGGGQVGYNWQSSDWVFGLEADAFFSNIEGSADSFWEYEFLNGNVGSTATSIDYEIEAFGTIRGRIGYAMDRFLPYITGGAAWASIDVSGESLNINSAAPNTSFSASDSSVEWGWALGAGAEYLITENLSIKGEYVYMDFGSHQANFTYSDGGAYNFESDLDIHTVKIGLNYHFN